MKYSKYLLFLFVIICSCKKTELDSTINTPIDSIKDSDFDNIKYFCANNNKFGDFGVNINDLSDYCIVNSRPPEWRNIQNGQFGLHEVINENNTFSSFIIASKDFKNEIGIYNAVLWRFDILQYKEQGGYDSDVFKYWDGTFNAKPNGKIKITEVNNKYISGKFYFIINDNIVKGTFKNIFTI